MTKTVSRLDIIFRRLLISKFFIKGWGNPAHIKKLFELKDKITSRSQCFYLVNQHHPIAITKNESHTDYEVANGRFRSPMADYLGDMLHPNVAEAHFQILIPKTWKKLRGYRPMCIHLAGTGDHHYWRRRHLMVRPLLAKGIGAIILENPFYGYRKPKEQLRSCLFNVSDIFVMGGCLILEVIALLHFCERSGFGPLGVTGLSMGGHNATLAATNWPKPVVLVPCLSGTTASTVFTEGVLSKAINWDLLQKQFETNELYSEQLSRQCTIVDNPSESGLNCIPAFKSTLQSIAENKRKFATPYDVIQLIQKDRENNKAQEDITEYKKVHWLHGLDTRTRNQKAIWFMRGLMDEFTHVRNFNAPVAPSLVVAIVATEDAYVPHVGSQSLAELWPGATVRHVEAGHVGAYVQSMQLFQTSIVEAFERAKAMYKPQDFNVAI